MYETETADAQAKAEAIALKKYEEEKKAEEAEHEKNAAADPKAKKAAPPKGKGKDADKGPDLGVPTIAVPEILPYESKMGKAFLYERSVDDIAVKLMTPAPTEEESNAQDADNAPEASDAEAKEKEKARETPDASRSGSKADLNKGGKDSKAGVAEEEEE